MLNPTPDMLTAKLSPHLFWDVDISTLNFDKNKAFVVKRVLEYGLLHDWVLLNNYMGLEEITEVAKKLRDLDDISLNFIAKRANQPKESFRCYTNKLLQKKHFPF
ncbi:MAG: DUF6922 domain-containing protein [Bacteroidia bacterium]